MAYAADMLTTCVLNAGLITKLRDLCPFPYGLFFFKEIEMRLMIITDEHPGAVTILAPEPQPAAA